MQLSFCDEINFYKFMSVFKDDVLLLRRIYIDKFLTKYGNDWNMVFEQKDAEYSDYFDYDFYLGCEKFLSLLERGREYEKER